MSWWTIKDLKENKVFNSDQLPLRLVPVIKEVDINNGHSINHKNFIIKIKNIEINFYTGSIWIDGKPQIYMEDPEKLLLFKRVYNQHGKIQRIEYFAGFINKNGEGHIARVYDNESRIEPIVPNLPIHKPVFMEY